MDTINDDFQTAPSIDCVEADVTKVEFKWKNLFLASFLQAIPSLGGLILVTYAFKFALLAEMNQGCIPSLFALAGIYISVLFYFAFNEVISLSKIFGILLMIPCVTLLSLASKS